MYGNNCEAGLFIISNFRQLKVIPIYLDLGECEAILQRLERNWGKLKNKEYPEPIEYNAEVCGYCGFSGICPVLHVNEGAAMIDSPELTAKLDRREELSGAAKEYKNIDDEVKENFKVKGIAEAVVGNKWMVKVKRSVSVGVDTKALPQEVKEQYKKESERTTVTFTRI
jgi:hypothetical protein